MTANTADPLPNVLYIAIFYIYVRYLLEEIQLHQNRLAKRIWELIDELTSQGMTQSLELSETLERDHGIKLSPHVLAEYKYRKRKIQNSK
jgi:predicted transcriptional regulator